MFNKQKVRIESALEILSADSSYKLKEAYNSLATNIIYLPITDKCKKIAVTSALYGEGKTSVAINLAISLATNLLDKKILLVDADMHSGKVAEFMGKRLTAKPKKGLGDFLSDSDAKPHISNTEINNLDVFTSGKSTANPAGLIRSDKMRSFINECSAEYDYIIIDAPPVNEVSDSLLLAGNVNGFVISVRNKHSSVSSIDKAQKMLASVGAEIYGMVLTDNK